MSTTVKFVTVPSKTLAASINAAASAIQLSDIKGWDGNNLTSANFGDVLWVVLRNSTNTQMELMQLDPTTVANSSITILKRGLDFSGGVVEVTANKLTWIKNDTIVELGSNPPQLLNQAVCVTGVQSIADLKTFTTMPQCTAVPTNAADLANKAYVDSVVGGNANYDQNIVSGIAGANLTAGQICYQSGSDGKWNVADSSSANTSVGVPLGIVQATVLSGAPCRILIAGRDKSQTTIVAGSTYYLSTSGGISTNKGANIRLVGRVPNASTTDIIVDFYGASNADVALTDNSRNYVADTGTTNVLVATMVPSFVAYKTGQLFYLKVLNTNSGAATVNINALGAKTIKKGNGTIDLASGDIVAGQLITLAYDGTNMQLLSPTSNLISNNLQSATTVVNVSSATAPSSGQVLTATSTTAATWQTPAVPVFSNGVSSKNAADASTSQTIAHGLGKVPKRVEILANVSGGNFTFQSTGVFDASGQNCVCIMQGGGITSSSSASIVVSTNSASDGYSNTGVVSVDATNITITWTRVQYGIGGGSNTWNVFWKASA